MLASFVGFVREAPLAAPGSVFDNVYVFIG
jgi:hypothetical protein